MSGLFDDLHAWTFRQAKRNFTGALRHRMALRQARRYAFDRELTSHVKELTDRFPDRLPDWLTLARLPFEHVWIELDESEDEFEASERGFLFSRINGDPTRWVTYMFGFSASPFDSGSLDLQPVGYVVNTETLTQEQFYLATHPPSHEQFPHLFVKGFESLAWAVFDKIDRGQTVPPKISKLVERTDGTERGFKTKSTWFTENVYPTVEPSVYAPMFRQLVLDDGDFAEFHREYIPTLSAGWRSFNIALAALSILNDVPTERRQVRAEPGRRMVGGKGVDHLDYEEVTLTIKAKKPVHWLRRRLDHSLIRKRAHEVKGHWRTYFDRESGEIKRQVWIETHERGDPNLGRVVHTSAPKVGLSDRL